MNKILLPVLLLFVFQAMGQVAPDKYYIQFTDKDNSPYTLDQPEDFLTQRAIDRRTKQGIAIDDKDLPVNPQYLQGVSDQGAQLLNATRWFNGVTIYTTNSTVLDNILDLPYVQGVLSLKDRDPGIEKSYFLNESIDQYASIEKSKSSSSFDYGWADYQINQINGAVLHDQGYR